jgi:hypothetical protein
MKNITLAMVAALVAVTMLSAVLAVAPMQQANAWDKDGKDGKDGDNKVIIKQSNKCEKVEDSCTNDLYGKITQNSGEDDFTSIDANAQFTVPPDNGDSKCAASSASSSTFEDDEVTSASVGGGGNCITFSRAGPVQEDNGDD